MTKIAGKLELSSCLMTYRHLLQAVDISFLLSTVFAAKRSLTNLSEVELSQRLKTSILMEKRTS